MKKYNLKKSEVVGALWEIMKIDMERAKEIRSVTDKVLQEVIKPYTVMQPVKIIEDILNELKIETTEEIVYVSYMVGAVISRSGIGYLNKPNN